MQGCRPSSRHKGRSSRWSADRRKQKTRRMTPMFCPLPFSTWLIRITINAARMRARAARPQEEYDTVLERDATDSAVVVFPGNGFEGSEEALGRSQISTLLEAAVAGLPTELRLVFLLHEVEGLGLLAVADRVLRTGILVSRTGLDDRSAGSRCLARHALHARRDAIPIGCGYGFGDNRTGWVWPFLFWARLCRALGCCDRATEMDRRGHEASDRSL